ncbi:MAG: flagellar basal body rod protein FlgB [Nitrospirae bacterium]|nr:flagellar basal body rod protein FlgB [Nitrospirota bacterium]
MDKGVKNLEKLMEATTFRHRVLSSNIANSDTPGYKARDVDFSSYFDDERMKMYTTNRMHYKDGLPVTLAGLTSPLDTLLWGDSNNVEIDMEVAKMTENAMKYQASVKLISQKFTMYKDAIKRRP